MWNYAAQGIFHKINGLILARPYNNKFTKEYNNILIEVIRDQLQLFELPIISEMDFGHTCPIFTIPYGIMAEIDCDKFRFSLIESALTD